MSLVGYKGIGEKRAEALQNAGIFTALDLVSYLPCAYHDLSAVKAVPDAVPGAYALLEGEVLVPPRVRYVRKGLNLVSVKLACTRSGAPFSAVYFNQPYRVGSFLQGATLRLFGLVKGDGRGVSIFNALTEPVTALDRLKGILTLYPPIADVPERVRKEATLAILTDSVFESVLPEGIRERHALLPLDTALRILHAPPSFESIAPAARAAGLEKLVQLLISFAIIKGAREASPKNVRYCGTDAVLARLQGLPFALSEDQKTALDEILADMSAPHPMNRLLYGEVGSGKTVLAFLAMYLCFMSGHQSALMAPTEILARQHYSTFGRLFPEVPAVFLSG
ncbi:MAG: DEAD/DEAH box helicase family protein, partial [Clostridiales bacterium]|nr:DEAD/DEAH box helicase family protein [Clostridiales bacterium]